MWPQVRPESSLESKVDACALLMSVQNDFLSFFFYFLAFLFLFQQFLRFVIKQNSGNFVAVQRLGLCAFTAKGAGSVPGQRTKILQAKERGQYIIIIIIMQFQNYTLYSPKRGINYAM